MSLVMDVKKWVKAADTRKEVRGGAPAADGYDCGQIRTRLIEKARDRCVRQDAFASVILLYFAAVFIHLVPSSSTHCFPSFCSSPSVPPWLPSLPPSLLPLACTSSGHGSLSQLQRGCVWTGYLSYCPAHTTLLKHKCTQMHACSWPNQQTQMIIVLSFFMFLHLALFINTHTLK